MRSLLIITIVAISIFSCDNKTEKAATSNSFQLIIQDTTNNRRARWDLDDINYRSKLGNQIGLSDLKKGSDSLEIRLWYDFSFSNSQELYTLKFKDTSCFLTYHRIYPRDINYDDENRNRQWNPYADPLVDSSVSKSVLLSKEDLNNMHIDSIWLLKSQSELEISDSVGFTDCDSYIIEIADKKQFKYLRHHCAMGYYNKTKFTEILTFLDFCERITMVARKHNVVIPYKVD